MRLTEESTYTPILCNEDEPTQTEVGRAHDAKSDTFMDDATATGRNSVNTTSVDKLCSATCAGGDSDGIDP